MSAVPPKTQSFIATTSAGISADKTDAGILRRVTSVAAGQDNLLSLDRFPLTVSFGGKGGEKPRFLDCVLPVRSIQVKSQEQEPRTEQAAS